MGRRKSPLRNLFGMRRNALSKMEKNWSSIIQPTRCYIEPKSNGPVSLLTSSSKNATIIVIILIEIGFLLI